MLRSIKRYPNPASLVSSPFVASLDTETCRGCAACLKRCQMGALAINDKKAILDLNFCIGCGLCVSTCPTKSLSLVRKPKRKQPYVPKSIVETNIRLGKARGKLGVGKRVGMQVRSKLDRLLTRRPKGLNQNTKHSKRI